MKLTELRKHVVTFSSESFIFQCLYKNQKINMTIIMDIIHRLSFTQAQCFRNWICFCHQVKKEESFVCSWAPWNKLVSITGPVTSFCELCAFFRNAWTSVDFSVSVCLSICMYDTYGRILNGVIKTNYTPWNLTCEFCIQETNHVISLDTDT
jgi:hypothetical protein